MIDAYRSVSVYRFLIHDSSTRQPAVSVAMTTLDRIAAIPGASALMGTVHQVKSEQLDASGYYWPRPEGWHKTSALQSIAEDCATAG